MVLEKEVASTLNEPLRTNGKGSPLDVSISMELDSEDEGSGSPATILTIDVKWRLIRWG